MSEKPISPLRQRMLEDMSMRRFVSDTQREYIRAVKRLATFLGRSPDTATPEELRAFQLHLTETGVQRARLQSDARHEYSRYKGVAGGGRSLISAGPKIEIAAPYSDPDLICRKS
jgi:Phage integrase, N-terminal SAM-like domain